LTRGDTSVVNAAMGSVRKAWGGALKQLMETESSGA
jgi:hypothetical protein